MYLDCSVVNLTELSRPSIDRIPKSNVLLLNYKSLVLGVLGVLLKNAVNIFVYL